MSLQTEKIMRKYSFLRNAFTPQHADGAAAASQTPTSSAGSAASSVLSQSHSADQLQGKTLSEEDEEGAGDKSDSRAKNISKMRRAVTVRDTTTEDSRTSIVRKLSAARQNTQLIEGEEVGQQKEKEGGETKASPIGTLDESGEEGRVAEGTDTIADTEVTTAATVDRGEINGAFVGEEEGTGTQPQERKSITHSSKRVSFRSSPARSAPLANGSQPPESFNYEKPPRRRSRRRFFY